MKYLIAASIFALSTTVAMANPGGVIDGKRYTYEQLIDRGCVIERDQSGRFWNCYRHNTETTQRNTWPWTSSDDGGSDNTVMETPVSDTVSDVVSDSGNMNSPSNNVDDNTDTDNQDNDTGESTDNSEDNDTGESTDNSEDNADDQNGDVENGAGVGPAPGASGQTPGGEQSSKSNASETATSNPGNSGNSNAGGNKGGN